MHTAPLPAAGAKDALKDNAAVDNEGLLKIDRTTKMKKTLGRRKGWT